MTGIYKFTNEINGKSYIGQSKNIQSRYNEHYRAAHPEKYSAKNHRDKNSLIHKKMVEYKFENFSFTILEECDISLLDEREQYWIAYYHTWVNDPECNGYNITPGGQKNFPASGEKHSQAKLTWDDVHEIKRMLKDDSLSFADIIKAFPQISKSNLSMINTGRTWQEEGETYPLSIKPKGYQGDKNANAKITDNDALKIRELASNGMSTHELLKLYPQIKRSSMRNVITGVTFTHLPLKQK